MKAVVGPCSVSRCRPFPYRSCTWFMLNFFGFRCLLPQEGDVPASGCGAGGGNVSGRRGHCQGGGDGNGWHDPYSPLRSLGDHAMRWWTFSFAAVNIVGGLSIALLTGNLEQLQLGWAVGGLLVISGATMSDADSTLGALGVKLAWGICALLAFKQLVSGWQPLRLLQWIRFDASGLTALTMCLGYMFTDMSAFGEITLPTNPGSMFHVRDVACRSRVWQAWGYGQAQMRC
uniref:MTF1320 n=1 Tax=Volvox carteri f. nagariensis TaxID=3068 RepID=D9CJ01_VOLCA|nr:MTF1320 [Volvox carteri f. nagariensis]